MATTPEVEAFYRRNVGLGSKIAGGVVGAIATFTTGIPIVGPIVAPVIAQGLERVGNEMIQRRLAPRQDERVGKAILRAATRSSELLSEGKQPRTDGFFELDESGRSVSDEITEAALLAAMNSAQERKVDYIGTLLANIAFDQTIEASTGHQLIEIAESVNYRTFALLKIIERIDDHALPLRNVENGANYSSGLSSLMAECYGMFSRGLMLLKNSENDLGSLAFLGIEDLDPGKMRLSPLGQLLAANLEVHRISEYDPVFISTLEGLRLVASLDLNQLILDGGGA
jgi:hypothetical protein